MSKPNHDHIFKILILGDSSVGKSCILRRFSDNIFEVSHLPTIGVDFKIKTLQLDDKIIKLQIWDTAGQERFNTITESYYRFAKGVIFVYDICNGKSFDNVSKWFRNFEESTIKNDEVIKYLVGNKCDLKDMRVVDYEKGVKLANSYELQFFETSAKDNINIKEVFISIAKDLVAAKEEEKSQNEAKNIVLSKKSKKTSNCCN